MNRINCVICKKKGIKELESSISDDILQKLLTKRAEELSLKNNKNKKTTSSIDNNKNIHIKKGIKPNPTSSIEYFKNKRHIEKFWA